MNDKMMEAYYGIVGEGHVANLLEELDGQKNDIDQVSVPLSLKAWLEAYVAGLVGKEKQAIRRKRFRSFSAKAAIVLLMLTLTGTILTFSVEAIRIRVFNMMLTAREEYTEIRFGEEGDISEDQISTKAPFIFEDKVAGHYYPTYIPEGYGLEESNDYGRMVTYRFIDGAGRRLYFDQSPLDGGMQIDTEDALVTYPEVGGVEAIMAQEDGQVILVWYNSEYAFTLIGEMTAEEALKIAESVEKE